MTEHLTVTRDGHTAVLTIDRPEKRNAMSGAMVRELQTVFSNLPREARVAVVSGEGAHFSAGLDLSEVTEQSVAEGIFHSRLWHAAFDQIQYGPVPVIVVLHGAVVGGGLACIGAITLIALFQRSFVSYDSRRPVA